MDDRHYYGPPPDLPAPPAPAKPSRKLRKQSPQAIVHQFWQRFSTQHPGKVFAVLPSNPHARQKRHRRPSYTGKRVAKSYDVARAECIRDVDRIIKECKRTNQKYRDLHFDVEWDLKSHQRNCLDGLSKSHKEMQPKGVKRVTDIFENPQFYINGPTAGDVRQGRDGDCYLMAALCALGNIESLIGRVCVKHDLNVGVYGFVFYRDGEWQQTIIDDKLYIKAPDYDEATDTRAVWDDITRVDPEEEYRRAYQTGSRALYFAQCSDENETWLPLLEKAYAKAHGDYSAIDGGFTGEAVEDLTGGVTTEIYSTDIMDKDAFWRDELMKVNKEFLFGCATGFYSDWLDATGQVLDRDRQGIESNHAYSIMEAREVRGKRLLKVRNPWGRKEWDGKWSDGSKEWDAEWMGLLDHKFGNDGMFWISYEDLLKKYQHFDRTRIFDAEWSVSQAWVGVDVGWSPEYHSTRFHLTVKEDGPVVIVLSQLDDTYFDGLEGPYAFDLQFRLEEDKEGSDPDDYIVRSNGAYAMARSVSTDIELKAGTYIVLMKITATRSALEPVEDILAKYVEDRRDKLLQMAMSYDLAHAKGVYFESKEEKKERKEKAEERRKEEKLRMKRKMRERAEKHWRKEKMRHDREKERRARKKNSKRAVGSGDEDESVKSRQGSGSLDAQPSASAMGEEGAKGRRGQDAGHGMLNGTSGQQIPVRIKSFGGETIDVAQPAADPTLTTANETTNSQTPATIPEPSNPEAEGVVQRLDEVVKAANGQFTNTTKPEAPTTNTDDTVIPPTPIVQVNGKDAITDVRPLPNLPPLSTPEHTLPPHGAQDTRDHDVRNGFGTRHDTFGSMKMGMGMDMGHRGARDDDNASLDSFRSFDWNSELDVPSDYDSESSSDDGASDSDDEGSNLGGVSVDPGDPARPNTSSSSSSSSSSDGRIIYKPPVTVLQERERDIGRERRFRPHPRDQRDNLPSPPDAQGGDGKADDGGEEPWNAVCVVGLRVYSKYGGKEGVELKVVWGNREEEELKRLRKEKRREKKRKEKARREGKWTGEKVVGVGRDEYRQNEGEGKVGENANQPEKEFLSPHVKLDPDDQGKGMVNALGSAVDDAGDAGGMFSTSAGGASDPPGDSAADGEAEPKTE